MSKIETFSVIKPDKVAACLRNLRDHRIHRQFTGYLGVRWFAAQEGRTDNLKINFRPFFDQFFAVNGGPAKRPYVYAFTEEPPSADNIWYNENVAGSYAQSSVRPDAPFREVVSIEGNGRATRYTLKERHWELALEHLTYGEKIPAVEVAVFFYRNYALVSHPPSVSDWVRIFRKEFGYSRPDNNPTEEFSYLFTDQSESQTFHGWFETLDRSESQ